jgi:glycosyltransferase involved in cell wall biosynthesis
MTWLSVLMPVYNGAAHLRAALDSVAREADGGVEVIAVDDGSTDDTVAILDAYADRLDLTVLTGAHTGNWVANTNRALGAARAAYCTVLHQDDLWLPGRLAAVREALRTEPALVVHGSRFVDEQGRPRNALRVPVRAGPVPRGEVLGRLLVQNFLAVPAVVFSRTAALGLGGLREDLWYTADWDLWLGLAAAGETRHVPRALVGYRVHAGALTMTRSSDLEGFRAQLESVAERHVPAARGEVEDWPGVARAARASIEVNVALCALVHRRRPDLGRLVTALLRLRPRDWRRYVVASRIRERVAARVPLSRQRP